MKRASSMSVVLDRVSIGVLAIAAAVNLWGCTSIQPLVVVRSVDVNG